MHAEIGADNVRQQLPGQSLNVPIGLIHLPKTGGTAIEASDWACPDLRCHGHVATARDWHLFGLKSLVILRDPVSRFVSAFEYARRGSDSAPISEQRKSPGKLTHYFYHFKNVSQFVDALANASAREHPVAKEALVNREGGIAFRHQAAWLAGAKLPELHVVCYSADNLAANLEATLRRAGSNCTTQRLTTINRTNRPAPKAPVGTSASGSNHDVAHNLSATQTAWILATYAEDAALHQAFCGEGASDSAAAAALHRARAASWPVRHADLLEVFRELDDDDMGRVVDLVQKLHELQHLRKRTAGTVGISSVPYGAAPPAHTRAAPGQPVDAEWAFASKQAY